ncbi:hypothetical protein [Formosa sp. PL04]|uniref:hypothetical protein n=1 Tax=Formosa sp. PL04 TaxID=3081755 RepID=UPI002980C707|nr:hypothetical protein [Formosa sp. PL04]MDW5289168.1 hypothetical protein [Formosa sp. PL04]
MKIKLFIIFFLSHVLFINAQEFISKRLSDTQIFEIIEKHRPSKGGEVPADLKYRLGATHVNGQYHLTDKPFIIEGAEKMQDLGYGILKLWFYKADGQAHGYKYNSDWNLTNTMTLEELANHKYYDEVFNMPFKVFALNIKDGFPGASKDNQTENLKRVENEFYDLTTHFLRKYKNREVTFILSNWEGDWMLRGGTSVASKWEKDSVSPDAPIRIKNMVEWIKARQQGVSRARKDYSNSKCKVFNAVEVNKVYDGILYRMPTITTSVLPHVDVDMVSWSAYDGKSVDGVKMYKGIDYLRHYMNPTPYMEGKKVVFIGEINEHENRNNRTKEYVQNFTDVIMGVYLAQDIPYIFYWELYSNDTKSGIKRQDRVLKAEELAGNWLIRPDGSFGWAQEYFNNLLEISKN